MKNYKKSDEYKSRVVAVTAELREQEDLDRKIKKSLAEWRDSMNWHGLDWKKSNQMEESIRNEAKKVLEQERYQEFIKYLEEKEVDPKHLDQKREIRDECYKVHEEGINWRDRWQMEEIVFNRIGQYYEMSRPAFGSLFLKMKQEVFFDGIGDIEKYKKFPDPYNVKD